MPFAELIGHRQILGLLRRAVANGRVPQAMLFAGPEGVGKRATAIALAQAVNCPQRPAGGDDACGVCSTCRRIAAGRHADVVLLDTGGEASIKIQPLRERVLDVVGFRPFEAASRVFIIDPADALTVQAQDALLKTLEEPPSACRLILVSASADRLAATVQSRCRRLRFGPLTEADVARVLVAHCGQPTETARRLAATSGGSVASALAAEDGSFAEDRDAALQLLEAAGPASAVGARIKAASALSKHESKRRDRDAVGARLACLRSLVRDLMVLWAGGTPIVNTDLEPALRSLLARYDASRLVAAHSAAGQAERWIERYANAKLVVDWLAVTL